MAISWAARKQIIYFLVFVIVIFDAAFFIWLRVNQPTCFDNKQNQGEEEIDCGGPCSKKCLGQVKDLIVLWSRFFETSNGKYDVASLVKNPNLFLALPSVEYTFKIYDKDNILITERKGEVFINPGETFPIFDTNIDVGLRIPSKVFIEFDDNLDWQRVEKTGSALVVSRKEFFNTPPFSRLSVTVENKAVFDAENIDVAAIFYDKDNNTTGASITKIDVIPGDSSQKAVFTWPNVFSEEPFSIEIFFRTGL